MQTPKYKLELQKHMPSTKRQFEFKTYSNMKYRNQNVILYKMCKCQKFRKKTRSTTEDWILKINNELL